MTDWRRAGDEESSLAAIFQIKGNVAASGSALMACREAIKQASGFDKAQRGLEDIDMRMQLAATGNHAGNAEAFTIIETHAVSMSGQAQCDLCIRHHHYEEGSSSAITQPAQRILAYRLCWDVGQLAKMGISPGTQMGSYGISFAMFWLAPLWRGRMLAGLLLAVLTRQAL